MAVVPMLTPNNAVLTTATIEIATLRLDKRQVTQAVFRQVHERSPIAANGGLIAGATPWGTINYWWADASKPDDHAIHLLWQLGNTLFRARLWQNIRIAYYNPGQRITGDLITPPAYDKTCLENLFWHRIAANGLTPLPNSKAVLSVEVFGTEYDVTISQPHDWTGLYAHLKALANLADGNYPSPEIVRHCGIESVFDELKPWYEHRDKIRERASPGILQCMRRMLAAELPTPQEVNAALEQTRRLREQATAAIDAYKTKTFPMLANLEQLYIAA